MFLKHNQTLSPKLSACLRPDWGTRWECKLLPLSLAALGILANNKKQEKEMKYVWPRNKLTFSDNIIVYQENPSKSIES